MQKSRSIAAILGPTMTVMIAAEIKFWNPTLYDTQIVPVIYLNGVLLFVAGLAIARHHNVWVLGWQTLITVISYLLVIVGLLRMFFPQVQQAKFENNRSIFVLEILLILTGLFLTFKAYFSRKQ